MESSDTPTSRAATDDATFQLCEEPVIGRGLRAGDSDSRELPRTYGTQTLCLMARDPRTVFAYWDIDWDAAFRERSPRHRKVHLRLLSEDGSEQAVVEVEPMAGSCYVTVPKADAAYAGEIGYFDPAEEWTSLASSELIATPPDTLSESGEAADFATVPFHLAFQRMIDLLRISKQENESLTAMLAELRERAISPDTHSPLSAGERELVHAIDEAAADAPQPAVSPWPNEQWRQQQLERILGFGASSPTSGFGGSGS